MDSNLLKEAIADAKAVRQTALANAKAALEEAFGSRLEAMFAPKLDEETVDAVPVPAPAPAAGVAQEEIVNETDIEEIIRELENELPQDTGVPPAPAPVPPAPDAAIPPAPVPPVPPMDPTATVPPAPVPPVPPMDPTATVPPAPVPMPPAPEGEEQTEEEMDEEIDINELLESLKAEDEEEDEEDEEEDENVLKEGVPVKSSGVGTGDNKEPSADANKSSGIESSGKSVDSANVGTPDYEKKSSKDATVGSKRPNQAKNATKTNLSTPGGPLKENSGGSTPGYPEGAKKTSTGKDPSEADRPNQAEHAKKDKLDTVPSPLKEENAQLKAQLSEAEQTLTFLRTQLNEINLLNAKLLYTNRLFKEYSMDNSKKMKIVEMFDLAKNVREVKMTYAVIAESLNFGADFKKRTSSKVQTITEGMASHPVAGTAPRQIIAESAKSEMVSKFQKLAGIKTPTPTTKK